eukprot:365305-Chlamydomonas_euryale.AAC.2
MSGVAVFEGSLRRPVPRLLAGSTASFATLGSFTLELTTLSRITGRPEFARAAYGLWRRVGALEACDGLYCGTAGLLPLRCLMSTVALGAGQVWGACGVRRVWGACGVRRVWGACSVGQT